jgi:glycosyltransferase involved in cell wall biosynthesis
MNNYKVSILIPVGSDRPFLRKALISAFEQDFDNKNYEVLLINDGCKRITKEKIEILKNDIIQKNNYKDIPNFSYHESEKNLGLSHTINLGIESSKGEYITILPDDDMFIENKLKVLAKFLDENEDIGAVYSLAKDIDMDDNIISEMPKAAIFLRKYPKVLWSHILNGSGLMVSGASCMYRKEVMKSVGCFDEDLKRAEEWEFHLRIIKEGHGFAGVPVFTTYYRRHQLNKSKKNRRSLQRKEQLNYIYRKLGLKK